MLDPEDGTQSTWTGGYWRTEEEGMIILLNLTILTFLASFANKKIILNKIY